MDSPSMDEEERHQDAILNVPINDRRDLEKSKPLISRAPELELRPANAKGERGEEQEADQVVVPSPVQFSCKFCPKVFSSGKALGGHKRIHSQAKKKQPGAVTGSSRQLEATVDREPITTCHVCNAKFPSKKAMSGHMRVHKDRPWRGLQPPERHSRVSPSPNPSLGSAMDDNLSQLNHSDRADDEPKAAGENPSVSFDDTDSRLEKPEDKNGKEDGGEGKPGGEMAEFADALMLLTHGDNGPSGFSPQLEEDCRADSECSPQPETDSGHWTCSRRALLQLEKLVKEKKRKLDDSDAGGGDDHGGDTVNRKMGMTARVYSCGICNRIFSSHQAYGGHLSGHNRIKKQTLGPDGVPQEPRSAAGTGSSSGKGMEKHKIRGIVGSRSVGPRHVLDFDLNEPPALDSDQGRR